MSSTFRSYEGFCPDCGSVLPVLSATGGVTCYSCKHCFGPEVFGDMKYRYVIHFNSREEKLASAARAKSQQGDDEDPAADGPVVERQCPKCDNNQFSYSTLQLRSADEGQTVFYTCTKCKHKETENS